MDDSVDCGLVLKKTTLPGGRFLLFVFTKKLGYLLISSFLKKKNNSVAASIQPLCFINLSSLSTKKNGFYRLGEFDLVLNPAATVEKEKLPVLFLIAEITSCILKEDYKNAPLFSFLEKSISSFLKTPLSSCFLLLFLISLADFLGFSIKKNNLLVDASFFSFESGVFLKHPTGRSVKFTKQQYGLFRLLLGTTFDTAPSVVVNKNNRFFFLDVLLDYYLFHIDHFRLPKSIVVLKEMYDN